MKNKKKLNQQDTLLTTAVKTGDIKAVSAALEAGAHINGRNFDGSTALFWAARAGALNIVQFLIDQGADVMARDSVGNTASSWASTNSHYKIAQLLALFINGATGDTPLMKAIEFNYREFIPALLKKEHNIDVKNNDGNTALMLAAYHGHLDLVLLLLSRNAELSLQNYQGYTALDLAEQRGHTQIAQWLSHYKAVHMGKQGGNTPLMKAAKWGYEEIIPFLLDKENHKEAKNQEGNNALLLAAEYGYQMAVSQLLKADVHLDEQNQNGNTALMIAAKKGYYNIAYLLLERGADLDIQNSKGQTALHFAAMGGYKELVLLLLAKGASVIPPIPVSWKYRSLARLISQYEEIGVTVKEGETPLMRAVKRGYFDLAKLWMAKGNDLNARNDKHETPLMISVQYGYRKITAALIEKGAQLNLLDNDQMTALNRARQLWFRNKEVDLLIESGATIKPRSEEAGALRSRMLPLLEGCLNRGDLVSALNIFKTCLETYTDPVLSAKAHSVLKKFFLEIPKTHFIRRWLNKIIDFFYPQKAILRAAAKIGEVHSKSRLAYETLVSRLVLNTPVQNRQGVIEQIVEKSEPKGRYKLRQKLYAEYNLTPPPLTPSQSERSEIGVPSPSDSPQTLGHSKRLSMSF